MRCPLCHVLIALTLLCNVLLLYYSWHLQFRALGRQAPLPALAPGITVIVREFRAFEHGLAELNRSFLRSRPSLRLLIASDVLPYPPVPGLSVLKLHPSPEQPSSASRPESHIHSRLVALVPDGTALNPPDLLDRMAQKLRDAPPSIRIMAAAAGPDLRCLHLNVSTRQWTAEYRPAVASEPCGAVSGTAVLMLRSRDLFELPFPLARPLQAALFIQAALRGWGVQIAEGVSFPRTPLPATDHGRWKSEQAERQEEAATMRALGVRLVRGLDGGERWFGCSKETQRCFGTVVGETPEYLYEGRWTPPCCLRALRATAHHVIKVLERNGVRYWLEGGSLLGAARHGDIIPWDYDVDLGIYLEDIVLCAELRGAQGGSLVDAEGFVWERAVEGDFFRVQYSQSNHLHVDLWPFYPRDGVMTRDSWTGHPQDVEFPESFLQPLQTIAFAGGTAQAPNRHLELLRMKFGEKSIEEPEYPNSALLSMRGR
ncbi:ribitol 5-phosphate transferase FKRP [Spea bombifrons]|uniref:ribitol 5-phosphate transferase FKRP n=1 Tax=Spea bombifrons TaxID=233779 RepID=UPI00234987A2|nr:ribitol 5-phosphate transferase FKRP [Spea bombifrons]